MKTLPRRKGGFEEETIADTETNYLHEVRDRAITMIHELIKIADTNITSSGSIHAAAKFPTFSGDIPDYRLFKELFIHFTKHLDQTECLYQLVESCNVPPRERRSSRVLTSKELGKFLMKAMGMTTASLIFFYVI